MASCSALWTVKASVVDTFVLPTQAAMGSEARMTKRTKETSETVWTPWGNLGESPDTMQTIVENK
jgi:hypothetical protein